MEAKAIYEGLGMSVSFLRRHKNRPDGEWSENRLDQVPGTLLGRPSAYYRESVLRWLRNYVTVSDGEMIRIAALPARPPGGTTVAASA